MAIPFLLAVNAAATAQTSYFGGDVRVISLTSGQASNQKLIMARTIDPISSLIIEDACVQTSGQPAQHFSTYIIISGNTATLSDSAPPTSSKTFTGTGTLYGQPWEWNYMHYTINFPLQNESVKIADDNFITPTQFIARKQLFYKQNDSSPETPTSLWDAELNLMTLQDYQSVYSAMGCK